MANPPVTALGIPAAYKLQDGFSCRVVFSLDPTVEMYIKTVTPPELDGGEMIPSSNMHNTKWHTGSPRTLVKLGDGQCKVAWNPICYQNIISLVMNQKGSVTYWFPDGSTLAVWGYLGKFTPSEFQEGNQPEATVVIKHTNYDYTNHVECGPLYTAGGTGTGLD